MIVIVDRRNDMIVQKVKKPNGAVIRYQIVAVNAVTKALTVVGECFRLSEARAMIGKDAKP